MCERSVTADLTLDERQAVAEFGRNLLEQLDVPEGAEIEASSVLEVRHGDLVERPRVIDGIAYIAMHGSLWKQDLNQAWYARRLPSITDGRLYAASDVYAQSGRALIDIVRVRT